MKNISLDEEDFKTLVSGGILDKGEVKIILKDIGFDVMGKILHDLQYTTSFDDMVIYRRAALR